MLHEFLTANREEVISRCRVKIARRHAPSVSRRELEFGIPIFLTQLTETLRLESLGIRDKAQGTAISGTAGKHGSKLLQSGLTVDQIVRDYGDLCEAVTELAIDYGVTITNNEFHTFNRCLDDAMADGVAEFALERDQAIRLGFLAHEFRNLTNTSILAVDVLKRLGGEINGSAGAVLDRSLKGMRDLCARALEDVRMKAAIQDRRERVMVAELVEEAQGAAAPEVNARGLKLIVPRVEPELAMVIDRPIVAGALSNLLQNAFKFTRPQGHVSLKALPAADRVLIEVEDECGGLPKGNPEELFQLFKQQGEDRSGLGLGLGISRRGVEVNGGRLYVRNLPNRGCVFTIDLPRSRPDNSTNPLLS
jgi:signal transduction histidine kinase